MTEQAGHRVIAEAPHSPRGVRVVAPALIYVSGAALLLLAALVATLAEV